MVWAVLISLGQGFSQVHNESLFFSDEVLYLILCLGLVEIIFGLAYIALHQVWYVKRNVP